MLKSSQRGCEWVVLCHPLDVFFNLFSRVFLRYQDHTGQEHIPRKGGVLFAANHASYSDIPLLGCGIPRRVAYLGRATLFPNRFFNWALRSLGWIPLKTDRIDRKAFGEAISLIKAGKPVVIFPEGTRSQDGHLKKGKPGIGVIVAETQCQVIPAYISGSHEGVTDGRHAPAIASRHDSFWGAFRIFIFSRMNDLASFMIM